MDTVSAPPPLFDNVDITSPSPDPEENDIFESAIQVSQKLYFAKIDNK